jgi:hypothetical protein
MTRSGPVTKVYSNKIRFSDQNKSVSVSSVGDGNFDGDLTVDGDVAATDVNAVDGIFSGAVSAGNTGIKWKVFTGTTNSGGEINFPHGLSYSTLLGAIVSVESGGELTTALSAKLRTTTVFYDTNVGNAVYKVVIFYA